MLEIHELLNIFSDLKPKNKEVLYNFLVNPKTYENKEEIEDFIQILKEMKDDLLYYDEEFDDIEEKEQKLYFTQKDLATMTGQSIRNIQRIIKENNINPINPGRKPLYYDLKEFNNYYFIQKKLTPSLKNQEINIIRVFGDKKEVKREIAMQPYLYQFLESMPQRNQNITLSLPDKGSEKNENEQYSNAV
ncbi:hypothetical protein X928_04110 [Petrotoga miotherma DSM 10691]|uniref:Helix-turn-helix domain-containing protein n=2 Tax=Petrotoga TaxID=28236 RepID=A0A2K1PDE6_9BACT|nr:MULTISPECIES: hypothetical protein [Petrotoga]PNS00843.1 hypothetical protein X928_04110 [Petrotoga miotherma DSM 10691]POZ91812.1 hypothetical protein AA81_10025 [Petrotoga halophila DSM 16923]